MAWLIIEEYENDKLVRVLRFKKEDILFLHDVEYLKNVTENAIKYVSEKSKELKGKLVQELGKSEHEVSNLISQPSFHEIASAIDGYLKYSTESKFGTKTIIDFKERGIYTRATIEKIKDALETDKDVKIKVYFKKEGDKYKIVKEEVEILE